MTINRRDFLSAAGTAACLGTLGATASAEDLSLKVQTVSGDVDPKSLGVVLTHEHAPIVDWSELFETQPAPLAPVRKRIVARTAKLLDEFGGSLKYWKGAGAVVETTPIRVGRYPHLLKELAQHTKVNIIASSGFWCEALAPQHPWAVRMGVEKDGVQKMADLFIREITEGMEDPFGKWGEKFTDIKAGIIKIGTSTYLRPSERVCHQAAAIASKKTGCPITTHTTNGGGLEEAELLLKLGCDPKRVVIGHQGYQDDRENDQAHDYHKLIAKLGCYVQFDRVGHGNYTCKSQAQQIQKLVEAGYIKQILISHDHAPFVCSDFTAPKKSEANWKELEADYTVVTTELLRELKALGINNNDISTMLVDNPQRMLAFAK